MGLAHNEGDLASSCFSLLLLKMVNGTHLILQKACHLEIGYYRMDGEGSDWNVFVLSTHILHVLFLSLLCLNSMTWIKLHCHYGDEFWGQQILHGHQAVPNELWFPSQMSIGQHNPTSSPQFTLTTF